MLPLDASINILNPVIATGDFPTNLCAIKILTELTDKQGVNMTDHHLDSVMLNIAKVLRYSLFFFMVNKLFFLFFFK